MPINPQFYTFSYFLLVINTIDNDDQEVRVKYTKKKRVGEGSVTEIAALMSFSKC
jgi:hypothetical protein